jgi:hypothetical protein
MNTPLNGRNDNGLDRDRVVAEWLGVSKQTLPRWDASERMKAMGWPRPIYLNGVRYRDRAAIRQFVKNAAAAGIAKTV